jgi:HK97 family phage prohead protease
MNNILDVDVANRIVKSVVAVFNNVDLDGDIIIPEAVTKTIRERGPLGSKLIWNLIDHNASMKCAIGKPSDLYVEGNNLIAVTPVVETELGEDYVKLCESGVVNQFSIGFSTIKSDMQGETRIIKELKLYEYSAVLWAANPATSMIGIKSNFKPTNEDMSKRLDALMHEFKHGTFTDETFSLMEIEIKQIQSLLTTQAAQALEPDYTKQISDELLKLHLKLI